MHTQAVLSLTRRRVNVLWAMLRDHHPTKNTDDYAYSPLDKTD